MNFLTRHKIALLLITAILFMANRINGLQNLLNGNELAQTKIIYNQEQPGNEAIIKTIEEAESYIYFVIYTVTREDIVNSLIAAKLRGLEVKGVTDFKQSIIPEQKPLINKMRKFGIEVKTPLKEKGLVHMKLLVTDKAYAMGSFNWTTSATNWNEEVLEIGRWQYAHDRYLDIFNKVFDKY